MTAQRIDDAMKYLGLTYSVPAQVTVVEMADSERLYGYFTSPTPLVSEDGALNNIRSFTLNLGKEERHINGDEIISLSLMEDGKRLYFKNDHVEENEIFKSTHPGTASTYQFFNPNLPGPSRE